MKQTKIIMGMPITVEIADASANEADLEKVFTYFRYVDEKFSPFKETSELTMINKGKIKEDRFSDDMKEILRLSEETKKETDGYFDVIASDGKLNPTGIVKGWAILNAAKILERVGFKDFYVDAGGDIQVHGRSWKVGIRNPFNRNEVVKVIYLKDAGMATSGTYIRGQHIYNPKERGKPITDIVSLTVIGSDVYEADRFATAAFAMGKRGIEFIENLSGFEGYIIDKDGIATMTSGFGTYTSSE